MASGILSGLLTASQCKRAETGCRIAPLQSLYSDPVAWTIWLDWINWLPGVVFGLLFAISVLNRDAVDKTRRVLLYAAASGVAYVMAGMVFFVILTQFTQEQFSAIVWVGPAGFAAGLVGATVLAMAANGLFRPSSAYSSLLSGIGLPVIIGAVAGVLFVFVCVYGEQKIIVAWPVAFVIWQVGVGLSLWRHVSSSKAALPSHS